MAGGDESEQSTFIQSRSTLFVLQEKTLSLLPADIEPRSFAFAKGDVLEQKYDILQVLGEGGMGVVYKAHHRLLDKVVALKTFKTTKVDEETTLRFQREARALAKLNHPNIVQIFDYGATETKMPYYTMEYLEGESLADLLKRKGRLSISESVGIFFQICHGLSAAHQKDILHRDLKPSNIFLSATGTKQYKVTVVDFGLAMITNAQTDDLGLTMQGVICGSPLYMSPEQGRAEPLSAASDIYSLGCTFYECLTGTAPFVGSNSLHTLMLRESAAAPPLSANGGGKEFPPELEKIVATMLQRDPARRQPNIEIVLDDLDYFARSRKKSASRVNNQTSDSAGNSSTDSLPSGKSKSSNVFVSLAISIVVLMLAGAAFSYFFLHKSAPLDPAVKTAVVPKPDVAQKSPPPTSAAPYCHMSKDGLTSIIDWPGHLIGREFDQIRYQKDRLTWEDRAGYIMLFSDEFVAEPRNFLTLRNVLPRKIYFGNKCTKSQLTKILQNLAGQRGLIDLHFESQPIDESDLQLLYKLPDLHDLAMTYARDVSAKALGEFALKKKLTSITYDYSGQASDLLKALSKDGIINFLSVSGDPLTSKDLQTIGSMSSLSNMRLKNCGLTDEGLKLLTSLPRVSAVLLLDNNLTPASIPTLYAWRRKVEATARMPFKPVLNNNGTWHANDIKTLRTLVPNVDFQAVDFRSGKAPLAAKDSEFFSDALDTTPPDERKKPAEISSTSDEHTRPICSIEDGRNCIVWPGHTIARTASEANYASDKFTWSASSPICICPSDEFCADPANFLLLKSLRVTSILIQEECSAANLRLILQNLHDQKGLTQICFDHQPFDASMLPLLAQLPDLRDLSLSSCKAVSGEAVAKFAADKKLANISWDYCGSPRTLLEGLKGNTNLRFLSLIGNALSISDVNIIATMSQLNCLRLKRTDLTDHELELLLPLTHVYDLRVQENLLTPKCIPTLTSWRNNVAKQLKPLRVILTRNKTWDDNAVARLKSVLPSADIIPPAIVPGQQLFDNDDKKYLRDSFR